MSKNSRWRSENTTESQQKFIASLSEKDRKWYQAFNQEHGTGKQSDLKLLPEDDLVETRRLVANDARLQYGRNSRDVSKPVRLCKSKDGDSNLYGAADWDENVPGVWGANPEAQMIANETAAERPVLEAEAERATELKRKQDAADRAKKCRDKKKLAKQQAQSNANDDLESHYIVGGHDEHTDAKQPA